jgi:hypothetical protein
MQMFYGFWYDLSNSDLHEIFQTMLHASVASIFLAQVWT